MLDVTAWIVAFALVWSPNHDFDDLGFHDIDEFQDEANGRPENNDEDQKKGH